MDERDGATPGFDPGRVRWSKLTYRASKLFVTADATVRFDEMEHAAVEEVLIDSPQGAPLKAEVFERLELESAVLGRRSIERVWFAGRTGAALQRMKRREGGKRYGKIYRHTRDGVFERRSEPVDVDEAVAPMSEWSKVRERWYPRPQSADCPVVLEPAILFYLLSAHPWWASGDDFAVCVFSKNGFHRLELQAAGREKIGVDYRLGGERRYGEVEALRITLAAAPVDGSQGGEAFELMDLEGAIELFVDPALGAPVEIRGEMSPLGEVKIRLVEASLR